MNLRATLGLGPSLIVCIICVLASASGAQGTLCQSIAVSTAYPHQGLPDQAVPISTTVAGSCNSDGEDYFAVRVDLVDTARQITLSTNSTPIGYNANNFSVYVENTVVTPSGNGSWPMNVNTYLVQAGSISGKYLLNSTTVTIQVGDSTLPEFQLGVPLLTALMLTGLVLTFRGRSVTRWD